GGGSAGALARPVQKEAEGHRLMLHMSKPRRPRKGEDPNGIYWHDDMERRLRLQAYCRRDVEVERELYKRLPPLSDAEQAVWQLDAEINRRGFHVDRALAIAARAVVEIEQTIINGSWFGPFRHRPFPEGRALHSAKAPCGSQPLGSYAAALASSKGRLIRCTVLGSTPKRFAIFRTPSVRPGAFRAAWFKARVFWRSAMGENSTH